MLPKSEFDRVKESTSGLIGPNHSLRITARSGVEIVVPERPSNDKHDGDPPPLARLSPSL
jgi:hypothetical protein